MDCGTCRCRCHQVLQNGIPQGGCRGHVSLQFLIGPMGRSLQTQMYQETIKLVSRATLQWRGSQVARELALTAGSQEQCNRSAPELCTLSSQMLGKLKHSVAPAVVAPALIAVDGVLTKIQRPTLSVITVCRRPHVLTWHMAAVIDLTMLRASWKCKVLLSIEFLWSCLNSIDNHRQNYSEGTKMFFWHR